MNAVTHERTTASPPAATARPILVFFHSERSGRCRRTDGYLAQVLQRRHNHDTFALRRVDVDRRADLAERFRIRAVPTILVLEQLRVSARLETPRHAKEIEGFLRPWLQ